MRDNGSQLVGAERELRESLKNLAPKKEWDGSLLCLEHRIKMAAQKR